jgi:hypothetical protein
VRDAAQDIAALARSGHVEAGGALPIQQRVQTSGRGDPELPHWSEASERAQRILGRGYAEGGFARSCAVALWLLYGDGRDLGDAELALALTLTLDERTRLERVREWSAWGVGRGARGIAAVGVELVGRAIGWYQDASEEPGCAGCLGQLTTAADAAHGALKRARSAQKAAAAAQAKTAKGRAA